MAVFITLVMELAALHFFVPFIFSLSKSSVVAVTQPAGWGGKSNEFKSGIICSEVFGIAHLSIKHFLLSSSAYNEKIIVSINDENKRYPLTTAF